MSEFHLFDTIRDLCALDGISGREEIIAGEILRRIEGLADKAYMDNLHNVIAFKKGRQTPRKKLMLAAHMDEVGFFITGITEEGFLRFSPVGGIDPKVLPGRRVRVGKEGLTGVIGAKALHQLEEEERTAVPDPEKLYIDIGAKDKSQAEAHVSLGDMACFTGDYQEFGGEDGHAFAAAKALDDRAGCAMLIGLLHQELAYDAWFVFTAQEEIGTRGAKTAAFALDPDIALILETTASGDVAGVSGEKRVTVVGEGAVVSYMDRGTIYDRELYELAFQIAREKGIPCQTKTAVAGGNDAGAIHVAGDGVRACALSVPCRYLHSPADMAMKKDIQAVYDLAQAMTAALGAL